MNLRFLAVVEVAKIKLGNLSSVFVDKEPRELNGSRIDINVLLQRLRLRNDLNQASKNTSVRRLVGDGDGHLLLCTDRERRRAH